MEFFNYAYCSLLYKHNEIENINILIHNIKKEIEHKKIKVKNILDVHLRNIFTLKYKLLALKHFIIKLILLLHKTKKEINAGLDLIDSISNNIKLNNSIKNSIYIFNISNDKNYNSIKYNIPFVILIKKITNYNDTINIEIQINNILLHLDELKILLEHVVLNIKTNNITIPYGAYGKSKNKLITMIQYKDLLNSINNFKNCQDENNAGRVNNLFNIKQILFKILQYDQINLINHNVLDFFKFKKTTSKLNKELTKRLNTTIKINDLNSKYKIKIDKQITSKVNLYTKFYKSIQFKKKSIQKIVDCFENDNKKSNDMLIKLKNELLNIENYTENIHKIECPDDIKQKCINVCEDEAIICCICLNNISFGAKTTCGHLFHIHCINLYIYSIINNNINDNIKILCPMCRKYI